MARQHLVRVSRIEGLTSDQVVVESAQAPVKLGGNQTLVDPGNKLGHASHLGPIVIEQRVNPGRNLYALQALPLLRKRPKQLVGREGVEPSTRWLRETPRSNRSRPTTG